MLLSACSIVAKAGNLLKRKSIDCFALICCDCVSKHKISVTLLGNIYSRSYRQIISGIDVLAWFLLYIKNYYHNNQTGNEYNETIATADKFFATTGR